MKKIVVILFIFITVSSCAFALFVTDLQAIMQTILQQMENIEHYAQTKLKWVEDLEQYKRQAEQIAQYYQQLKGIAEKFSSGSFKDIWNTSKELLKKCIDITNTASQIEEKTVKTIQDVNDSVINATEYLINFESLNGSLAKKIDELCYRFRNTAYWYADTFRVSYLKSINALARLDESIQENIELSQEKIDIYQEVSDEIDTILDELSDKMKDTVDLIETLSNQLDILDDSINTIQTNFSVLASEMETEIQNGTITDSQRTDYQNMLLDYQNQMNIFSDLKKTTNNKINNLYYLKIQLDTKYTQLKFHKDNADENVKIYQEEIKKIENYKKNGYKLDNE